MGSRAPLGPLAMPHETTSQASRSQSGVSLIEVMVAMVILAIALLGHVASTVAEDAMARDGQARSEALHAVRQFVERMRADEDWAGLRTWLQDAPTLPLPAGAEPDWSDTALLDDGRTAYHPCVYYADLVLPTRAKSLRVLVEIPNVGGDLREDDTTHPEFGLPADLNGDGDRLDLIDTDYRVLPVCVHATWLADGLGSRSMRITTWLGITQ